METEKKTPEEEKKPTPAAEQKDEPKPEEKPAENKQTDDNGCLLYTSPSPRD